MNIRQKRELKDAASAQLSAAPQAGRILLIYCGITLGLSALVTVVNYCLGLEISQTGGLKNIGIRSVLSTIQTVLPMIQTVVLMALELGYTSAMLRVARGQYASPNSLRMGMDRFWPLVRLNLVQALLYLGVCMFGAYLAVTIFTLTPAARELTDMIAAMDPTAMLDEATAMAVYDMMLPLFPLFGIFCLALMAPVFYALRMSGYVLIDNPGMPTLLVLRESRKMMKRNRFALFRLDLSFWYYYVLGFLATFVAYGDSLLPMLGISLPISDTVGYFLFYGIYLVLELGISWLFLNRISVTYALAYESLRPRPQPQEGVVLGNIFQM